MRKLLVVVFLSLMILSLFGCPKSATPVSKEPIKIGAISDFSGFFSYWGEEVVVATQYIADNVNAAGGVLGRQVEIITKDDQSNPSLVPQLANELKAAGCVAIIGPSNDPGGMALHTWALDNKIPVMENDLVTTLRTTDFNRYGFFVLPMASCFGVVLAQNISKQNDINSIYTIIADMPFLHEVYDSFWANMQELKPEVTNLGLTTVGFTETEYSGLISTILAKEPDAIFDGLGGPGMVTFFQQGKQFNLLDKTKIFGCFLLEADSSVALGQDFPVGVQSTSYDPFYLDEKPMRDYQQAVYSKLGRYSGACSVAFATGTLSIIEAIKKAGSTDPEKIVDALETLTVDTPQGSISYNDYDHQGNIPLWYGESCFSEDYPIVIACNVTKYQDIYPTKEEILALRGEK